MTIKHIRRGFCALLCFCLLLGALFIAPQAAGEDKPFRVNCTFYGDSKATVAFHWATKADAATDVKLFMPGGTESMINGAANASKFQGNYMHSIVVDGLEAGKGYGYQVGDAGKNVWSERYSFHTNPGAGSAISFVAITDVQAGSAEEYVKSAAVLQAATAKLPDAKAFYVHLGDYTNNSSNKEWDFYFDAFGGPANTMIHAPVAGNHDGFFKWDWFRNIFTLEKQKGDLNVNGAYYSFDYGDAHFAVLNTNDCYPMSLAQRNGLINDMNASAAKWKILFMHKGPYSGGSHPYDPDIIALRGYLLPIIEDISIDLVMSGHDHMYYRGENAGTAFILPNTAGPKEYKLNAVLLPEIKGIAAKCFQPDQPVYTTVTIDGGKLAYKAYYMDGTLFDQLTIVKTSFPGPTDKKPLNRPEYAMSVFASLWKLLFDYMFRLLPAAVGTLFGG